MELPNTSLEYFILKDGKTLGPFSPGDLEQGLAEGRFTPVDLYQTGREPVWRPLSEIIEIVDTDPRESAIPEWKGILKLAGLRLRLSLDEQAVRTGGVCLVAGAVVFGLARWPASLLLPWLAITVAAAVVLIRRRREVAGTVLLLGVIGVPFLFAAMDTWSRPRMEVTVEPVAAPAVSGLLADAPARTVAPVTDAPLREPVVEAGAPAAEPLAEGTPRAVEPGVSTVEASRVLANGVAAAGNASSTVRTFPPLPSVPAFIEKPAPAADVAEGDPLQNHMDALVIVKGEEGSGSGFVCRLKNRTWLFTNIHVAAGLTQPVFTKLDNTSIVPGLAEAAGGPDIVRFALASPPAHPFEVMTDVDANVRIGDEVVVLGNSGGGGVVTNLKGEVKGLGPDRIEVSAEFIPGNSGSPIIHTRTGKVIGIATYLTQRRESFGAQPTPAPAPTPNPYPNGRPGYPPAANPAPSTTPSPGGPIVIRRFGFRIDNVAQWQPVNWAAFRGEAAQVEEVSKLTGDILNFLNCLRKKQTPQFATETLRRSASDWMVRVGNKHLSDTDKISATQHFLGSLRAMSRSDVNAMEGRLQYGYFRNELHEERQARDKLYEVFDKECSSLISTSGHPGYR